MSGLRRGGPGRRAGVPNAATTEIKQAARAIVEDPAYKASLIQRVTRGKAPHMETLLFHYAYGKPVEQLEVGGIGGGGLVVRWERAE